ncbi:hypothetical protein H0X06_04830 [Candidatus Dependentiae bacterium]|nr:hypothetical protein [Candidatus Dependentiae bacterium]
MIKQSTRPLRKAVLLFFVTIILFPTIHCMDSQEKKLSIDEIKNHLYLFLSLPLDLQRRIAFLMIQDSLNHTFERTTTLSGHTDSICFVDYSPDEKKFLSVSGDGTLAIWDSEHETKKHQLTVYPNIPTPPPFIPDHMKTVAFTQDSSLFLTGFFGAAHHQSVIRDIESGEELSSHRVSELTPNQLLINGSANLLILPRDLSESNYLWSRESNSKLYELQKDSFDIDYRIFSPDYTKIVLISKEGTLYVYDATTLELLITFNHHQKPIRSIVFNHAVTKIVTFDESTGYVWSLNPAHPHLSTLSTPSTIISAAFSPDDTILFTCSEQGKVQLWDLYSGKSFFTLPSTSTFSALTCRSDGKKLLLATQKGDLEIWQHSVSVDVMKLIHMCAIPLQAWVIVKAYEGHITQNPFMLKKGTLEYTLFTTMDPSIQKYIQQWLSIYLVDDLEPFFPRTIV